ncbi:MAG: hypothetical protein IIC50_00590 [Planctomycetes bacterium]|nr:hypothetical protein [Planctomycetota bacterium]
MSLSHGEWLEFMAQHPVSVERPIVTMGEHASVGRPPENALSPIVQAKPG